MSAQPARTAREALLMSPASTSPELPPLSAIPLSRCYTDLSFVLVVFVLEDPPKQQCGLLCTVPQKTPHPLQLLSGTSTLCQKATHFPKAKRQTPRPVSKYVFPKRTAWGEGIARKSGKTLVFDIIFAKTLENRVFCGKILGSKGEM